MARFSIFDPAPAPKGADIYTPENGGGFAGFPPYSRTGGPILSPESTPPTLPTQASPVATNATQGLTPMQEFIKSYATRPGVNPSVINDPGYWERVINEHGGLTEANKGYFGSRMMTPEGPPERAKGRGGMWGNLVSQLMTQMPGAGGAFGGMMKDPSLMGQLGVGGDARTMRHGGGVERGTNLPPYLMQLLSQLS